MSSTTNQKSAAFLAALDDDAPPSVTKPAKASPIVRVKQTSEETPAPKPARAARSPKPAATSRTGLKHIGGYFDRDDVEKIAVLRARLGLDNSQLIRLAVDDLFKKHNAKRAFGDA